MFTLTTFSLLSFAPSSRPPNIVYFVTDDQDQMLGSSFPAAAPGGATPLPKVKKLMVDGGAMLENMFIHVPICNPSRSTTLTGRYFHNIKTTHTGWATMHCDMAKVHNHSFAVRLQQRGYTLGMFGKYLNAMPGTNTSHPGAFVPAGWSACMPRTGARAQTSRSAPELPLIRVRAPSRRRVRQRRRRLHCACVRDVRPLRCRRDRRRRHPVQQRAGQLQHQRHRQHLDGVDPPCRRHRSAAPVLCVHCAQGGARAL